MLNPTSPAAVAQITSEGQCLQGKTAEFTLRGALASHQLVKEGTWATPSFAGAYLHVPFCFHKCHYCDFYSIVDRLDRQEAFTDRLIAEMQAAAEWVRVPLDTVFVGGGTPTLLKPQLWEQLLTAMTVSLPLVGGGEFTVEANPETVTDELAAILVAGGVNRVSIGAQSFDLDHLKTLERWHQPANVSRSIDILRKAGIPNINLDLIFGIPGQTVTQWQRDLEAAIALKPDHVSCYGLMYESNTPLTRRMQSGEIKPVDQDIEAAMYESTIDLLGEAGYEHYEISNWSRGSEATRCRHNLLYWHNRNWLALGPSASGHCHGLRWKNVARLGDYLASSPLPAIVDVEYVDKSTRAGESFMLGLRLIDGLTNADVKLLLARSGDREPLRASAIKRHADAGLLEERGGRLRLTRRGLLLANSVLVDLV